jgi:hypothetical protein
MPRPRQYGPRTRIEMQVPDEFLARLEAWRQTQPGPPDRLAALLHLLNLGLQAAVGHREYRPAGRRRKE